MLPTSGDKVWKTKDPVPAEFVRELVGLPPLVAQVLWNRGLADAKSAAEFLDPQYERDVHDPFLFRDMERAVDRVRRAITGHELVIVHGDYDADGVCGAAVLYRTLRALGATVRAFLPHREDDGYGLQEKTVTRLAADGAKLIITCDCGISNAREIALAASRGIDVIITDHHALPDELPRAYAILHPGVPGETYPWRGLSGGGVAFKLVQALMRRMPGALAPGFEKWLLDLVSISSVADMVPLRGETRALVSFGLRVMSRTHHPGLRALFDAAGLTDETGALKRPLTATSIGFDIAPRINAAGRMEHADMAFQLLTTDDPGEAITLAAALTRANSARRVAVQSALEEARSMLKSDPPGRSVVLAGESWRAGIVGLIAGKIADEMHRPTFIFSLRNGIGIGSGRGVPGLDLVTTLRGPTAQIVKKFGGHAQACGVTIDAAAIPQFRSAAETAFAAARSSAPPELAIDARLLASDCTTDLAAALEQCAPFGIENPEPVFNLEHVTLLSAQPVGAEGKHARLTVRDSSGIRNVIAFGKGALLPFLTSGTPLDIACNLRRSFWNGSVTAECVAVAIRAADGAASYASA